MTTETETEFWMSAINANVNFKNPNYSDEQRIQHLKKTIIQVKKRELAQYKQVIKDFYRIKENGPSEQEDYEIFGFSIRRLMIYLRRLTPEHHVTTPIILGVFWNGDLPPKTEQERTRFEQYRKDFLYALEEFRERRII